MKDLAKTAVVLLALLLTNTGCERQEADPGRCYSGKIVYRVCGGYAVFVQVNGAPLGTGRYAWGGKYDNVVALTLAEPAPADSLISFSINRQAANLDDRCVKSDNLCVIPTYISIPENVFCATNISIEPCKSDEK